MPKVTTFLHRFQSNVNAWVLACFGPVIAQDTRERNHRFLEESLELVQACDCTREEAHKLVDYVFSRSRGDKEQETGGVLVTLAALCNAQRIDMADAGLIELVRVWDKIDAIREKQARKQKDSCLP